MSQKNLKPSSTELVIAGQPSSATLAKLKAIGELIIDTQITTLLRRVETARANFQVQAVEAGLLLLAKKQTMKHGQWLPWVESLTKSKLAALPPISYGTRSIREYTFLAQHFLADLEQSNFQPDERDHAVIPPAVTPDDVLALQTLPEEKRLAVSEAIEGFVAGRSLRRMLTDFRRAESASDQEEIEEANRRRKSKKPAGDVKQLEMFDEFLRPLGELDTLFDSKSFLRKTDRKFWLGVADKLETQAARARVLAKEIAS